MKFVVIGCLCAGALAAVGCADGRGRSDKSKRDCGCVWFGATAPG